MSLWLSVAPNNKHILMHIPDHTLREQVARALAEDIGSGDVTAALVPEELSARANIISREAAVLCGTAWVNEVFQ